MKMGATPISFSSFLSSSPCISFSSPSLSSPCISFSSPSLSSPCISFSSPSLSSPCISFSSPSLSSPCISFSSPSLSPTPSLVALGKSSIYRGCVACSAIQESSTPTTTSETKAPAEANPSAPKPDAKAPAEAKAARPKPPAKAPTKPLPELMLEDVIPSLKTILEAQDVLSQINLTFQDNKLEGSFIKEGYPYSFWAFFPDGVLTGPKGFSLSSYGSGPSTVEPFLIDEKKITARHVVFWVEKRLAAQGIIPVWNE